MTNLTKSRFAAGVYFFLFSLIFTIAFVPESFSQERAKVKPMRAEIAQPAPEIKSLCNPAKTSRTSRDGTVSYVCEGKRPTPKAPNLSLANPDRGGLKAEINCTYTESGGAMKWTGCTCSSDDDGNCNNFISWCAEQGDTVEGNSGGASCSPGG